MERYNEQEYNKNYRVAMVMSAIYNSNLDKFQRKEPFTPEDIIGKEETEELDMQETAEMWTQVMGGVLNE